MCQARKRVRVHERIALIAISTIDTVQAVIVLAGNLTQSIHVCEKIRILTKLL